MTTPNRTLVLFDIDGTLIHSARAGLRGMNAAFADLHQQPDALARVPFAGRTDRSIVLDAFRAFEVEPTDAQLLALRDAYLSHLPHELRRPVPEWSGVLPGVTDLLDALDTTTCGVGLLTGNFVGGAEIKLGHFDLWRRFRFGAFGDDHIDRRDLVPVALASARAAGFDAAPAHVVVIGDTPLDVACAHAHGAMAVAVTTGPFSRDQLTAAGADLVVDSLGELVAFDGWLTSPARM